jgi:hypothetical protein
MFHTCQSNFAGSQYMQCETQANEFGYIIIGPDGHFLTLLSLWLGNECSEHVTNMLSYKTKKKAHKSFTKGIAQMNKCTFVTSDGCKVKYKECLTRWT